MTLRLVARRSDFGLQLLDLQGGYQALERSKLLEWADGALPDEQQLEAAVRRKLEELAPQVKQITRTSSGSYLQLHFPASACYHRSTGSGRDPLTDSDYSVHMNACRQDVGTLPLY